MASRLSRYLATGLLAIFFASTRAFCASQAIGGPWGGLNDGDASILIPDNDAQSLQDVDITQFASGIKKRGGYTQFRTIGVSTWAVRGGYYFRDASGNDVLINANSMSVFKSVNSGAYSAFITTATNGAYWDFTDSLGYLYGANSANDQLWRYDGTTLTWFPSAPKGTQVEFSPDRFIVTGVTTTGNTNTVYFSKASDPTTFTTGPNNADPFTEVFGLPGQKITAMKYALGRLIVWTKTSTQFWAGTNQYDGVIQDISTTIGCIQPGTVIYDNGIVYWEAQDKHWYAYDGNQITRISRKIATSVAGLAGSTNKAWTVDTQADFASGVAAGALSTSYSPGDVVFSTFGVQVDALTGLGAWTLSQSSFNATASASGGIFDFVTTSTGPNPSGYLYGTPMTFSNASILFNFVSTSTYAVGRVVISTATSGELPTGYSIRFDQTSPTTSGDIVMTRYPAGIGDPAITYNFVPGNSYAFNISLNNGNVSVYINNALVHTFTDSTYTSFKSIHVGTGNQLILANLPDEVQYSNLFISSSPATYQSPAFNIGSAITGYGAFVANNVLNNGTITYALYVHNASNISTSVFTSSQTITSGSIPAFGVQPYALWTAQFSRTVSTYTPTLNDVTVNWYEGTPTTHWGTVDKDHRLIWSVAEGTATVPNVSYIYDPRFTTWLKYSFPMDVPAKVGDTIYFGGVSTGVVYNWPSGNNDNGAAINAFWQSKDFIAPDPFIEKAYGPISLISKTQTGSNLNVTYTVNTSSSNLYNISLTDANGNSFVRNNRNIPLTFGTFFNIKFGNTTTDSPFEVYAIKYDYTPKAWRVLP